MYAKPVLQPLDLDAPQALCCEIWVKGSQEPIRTPLCAVPFCAILSPCSVTVGPVTVSG